jgi:hypothetical protein
MGATPAHERDHGKEKEGTAMKDRMTGLLERFENLDTARQEDVILELEAAIDFAECDTEGKIYHADELELDEEEDGRGLI